MIIKPILTIATIGITAGFTFITQQPPKELISPLPAQTEAMVVTITPSPTPEPTPAPLYEGKVSYYSHEGCLGCSDNQTMGNGQPFDENAMTLAVPCEDVIAKRVKYNTKVTVTNQDNGKSVEATITDCGGFSKYGRVADLSKGMYQKLGAKTDKTVIKIERVK